MRKVVEVPRETMASWGRRGRASIVAGLSAERFSGEVLI